MLAFTFPGQGSQKPGWARPWREQPSWELVGEASEVAGRDIAQLLSRPTPRSSARPATPSSSRS
jgi:malonyl CoA-acyl carrier protein transacylase